MTKLNNAEALDALNELRSNIVATQNASWSNVAYPLVAILNAAGYELIEDVSEEQLHQHVACYGGAGGFPGHLRSEPRKDAGWRHQIKGKRERDLESLLRRQVAGVKPPTEDEIREALRDE